MLFASRLPATLDFILPRRAGWALFAGAFEAFSRRGPRLVFTGAVLAVLASAAGRFLWLTAQSVRRRTWSPRDFLSAGALAALVVLSARWSASIWLELSMTVWFPYGCLDPLEPAAHLVAFSAVAFAAMASIGAFLGPRAPRPLQILYPWTAANLIAAVLASSLYGAWRPEPVAAEERRLFVVLTEESGRPGRSVYDLPVPAAAADADESERRIEGAGVRRLERLRRLYESRAKLMDADGLRRALLLGVEYGDDLARVLLLEHLSVAPVSSGALGALGALADESAHRIGPLGAARIARAYAHLGDSASAAVWSRRAAEGPRGIPAGLVTATEEEPSKPGRLSGRVAGPRPLAVALYRKTDPGAPYLLDAGALVAAATPSADGRFQFSGLTAGRYYLAFAYEAGSAEGGELTVRGHRGDLTLEANKPVLTLPLLTIRPRAR